MRTCWLLAALLCSCARPSNEAPELAVPPGPVGARALPLSGPCGVALTKINYDQSGVDDGSLELIELRVSQFTPGATFADCGVIEVASYEGGGAGDCKPESSTRSIFLGDLPIPEGGIALLGRGGMTALSPPPDAVTRLDHGSFLRNGPAFVTLEGPSGVLAAHALAKLPTCSLPGYQGPITLIPPDGDSKAGPEHLLVLCGDTYEPRLLADTPLRAPNECASGSSGAGGQPAAGGAPGGGGSGGSAGSLSAGGWAGGGGEPAAGAPAGPHGGVEIPGPAIGCRVRFSKIDVAQPADAARPRDPAEAIELEILGPLPAGARLADCGVTRFSPYNANDDEGGCGPAAGYYEEVEIGDLLVPPSRRVVLGLPGSAVYPWPSVSGQSFSVLHDGPDYLVLRGPQGEPRSVVAYPSPERPTILPGCNLFAGVAEILPADAPTSAEPPRDQVLVRCSGGWGLVPLAAVAWGQPTRCPAAEVAAPPDTPEQAGGGAGAPDLPEGGSAGVAGRGGAPVVTELDPGPTPTCGCRLAPDSPGDRRGAALLLGLAGLAARRRGARGGGARSSGGASSFPWEGAGGQNARHGAPRDRSRHHRHDGPPA